MPSNPQEIHACPIILDDEPEFTREPLHLCFQRVRQLQRAVTRDLEALLNTRHEQRIARPATFAILPVNGLRRCCGLRLAALREQPRLRADSRWCRVGDRGSTRLRWKRPFDLSIPWISHVRMFALPWLLMLMLFGIPSPARSDDFIQEHMFFRVNIGGRTFRLEGLTVKRADARGRLPIALITHGKPANLQNMLDKHATDLIGPAKDLAQRGWLAVVVMRRGFGHSDGPLHSPVSCQSTSFVKRFSADADDLAATLNVITSRPDVDATRVIAIGVSAGGAAVIALSARNPPNLRAVINISGGLHMKSCPKEAVLVKAFKKFGTKSRISTLWIYAENDSRFRPDVVGLMRDAFLDGGGDAKLVMFDPLGQDGHDLFFLPKGRLKWLQEMDALLRFHTLPTWQRQDVSALMSKLNAQEQQRGFIERFVAAPVEKALAQSSGGKMSYWYGSKVIGDVRKRALMRCQQRNPLEQCTLVMENDHWIGAKATPAPMSTP